MGKPLISVVIPARNESDRVQSTIRSILDTSRCRNDLEFVIVDDASEDHLRVDLTGFEESSAPVNVYSLSERKGVPGARNHGVRMARGEIVFITDAHIELSEGWDQFVLEHIRDNRILAATIRDKTSPFHGYGCSLIVPFMGTRWNRQVISDSPAFVHIASSAGTVLTKACFEKIGGYDEGMIYYGGAEPEFSLRAWLSGAEIVSDPNIHILHRFKPKPELSRFVSSHQLYMTHNHLRFGLLYLSELASLQMIRHYSQIYPNEFPQAIEILQTSDVWERKQFLSDALPHNFEWFVRRFGLKDQADQEILF